MNTVAKTNSIITKQYEYINRRYVVVSLFSLAAARPNITLLLSHTQIFTHTKLLGEGFNNTSIANNLSKRQTNTNCTENTLYTLHKISQMPNSKYTPPLYSCYHTIPKLLHCASMLAAAVNWHGSFCEFSAHSR